METDQKKKDVESNFNYLHKVNDELDKNLDEKKKELLRLKKIRSRYNSDVKQVNWSIMIESGRRKKKEGEGTRTPKKISWWKKQTQNSNKEGPIGDQEWSRK